VNKNTLLVGDEPSLIHVDIYISPKHAHWYLPQINSFTDQRKLIKISIIRDMDIMTTFQNNSCWTKNISRPVKTIKQIISYVYTLKCM